MSFTHLYQLTKIIFHTIVTGQENTGRHELNTSLLLWGDQKKTSSRDKNYLEHYNILILQYI